MVSQRAAALGINLVHQGCEDKLTTLKALCERLNLNLKPGGLLRR